MARAEEPGPRRIPEATVARLPVYQRILAERLRSGERTVSSEQLAEGAGVNAAKVRRDLSLLGSFGTRGTGYDTGFLMDQIDRALGVHQDWPVAVVGIGNLGRALVNSEGFSSRGFRVASLFDRDPSVVGQVVGGAVVRHVDTIAALPPEECPAVGVVATPASVAQEVADALVAAGVPSILNFAPCVLRVPPHVLLRYVDLSIELQVMSFYLTRQAVDEVAGPAGALWRAVGLSAPPG
ncbi:MAG TPA: redox-sensing transcriptional repressor Rex [Acidimicrobiales bacterium]|nr:redox-sensing transcriptional repressor Rex [Acidimicrobiales bacterium]